MGRHKWKIDRYPPYLFWRIIAKKFFSGRYPVPISTKKLPTRRLGIQRKLRQLNSNIPTILILHEFDLNFGTVVMWENWVWWERSEAATEVRRKSKRRNKKCLLQLKKASKVLSIDIRGQSRYCDTNRFFFATKLISCIQNWYRYWFSNCIMQNFFFPLLVTKRNF